MPHCRQLLDRSAAVSEFFRCSYPIRVFIAFHGDSAYAAITAIKDSTCPVTKP